MRLIAVFLAFLAVLIFSCNNDFEYQTEHHGIIFGGFYLFNFKEVGCELNEHNYQDYEVCFVDTFHSIKVRLYTFPEFSIIREGPVKLSEFRKGKLIEHLNNRQNILEFHDFERIEIGYDFTENYLLKRQVLIDRNRSTLKMYTDITLYGNVLTLIVEKPYNMREHDLWTEMEKLKKIRIVRHNDIEINYCF